MMISNLPDRQELHEEPLEFGPPRDGRSVCRLDQAGIFADMMSLALMRRMEARIAQIDAEVAAHWRDLQGYNYLRPHQSKVEQLREWRRKKRLRKLWEKLHLGNG